MSDQAQAPALLAIGQAKDRFTEISKVTQMAYQSEAMFAMQALQKNDYIWGVANKSPASVRDAVINVASIGLSLNPATSYAYLVPRDNRICLDISYQGLIKIATDTGSIRWAKAELVHENDHFVYKGMGIAPEHEFNPFKPRGEIVGVYCVAKTSDGDYLCDIMSREEIDAIMKRSEAYKAFAAKKIKSCPWVEFYGEMTKKTIIKRASKTWPKSQRGDMLQHAIEILNAGGEGIDFNDERVVETKSREQIEQEQYDALCELYMDSLITIREGIKEGNLSSAVEAWCELPEDAQMALWKAPSKGGWFTTAERAIMQGNEWSAERNAMFSGSQA